jgi:hypothetical protein
MGHSSSACVPNTEKEVVLCSYHWKGVSQWRKNYSSLSIISALEVAVKGAEFEKGSRTILREIQ